MPKLKPTFFDRAAAAISPAWALRRVRARISADLFARHFEAASTGRRTQGWNRSSTDANAAQGGLTLQRLRDAARDLIRNNPYAQAAVDTIAQHAVGWGIVPTAKHDRFKAWSESVACDASGQTDLVGLCKLVMRTTPSGGETIVRRRWRRPDDRLPLPFQLEVLEGDFLDTSVNTGTLSRVDIPVGNRVVQGVEFDGINRPVAYWLFKEHPGALSTSALSSQSVRVLARDVLHIFRTDRPGQVRGATWFASVLLRFKDTDEYEDATLMKQKVAACLAVLTTDTDGGAPALGTATTDSPEIDSLEPGMIANLPAGKNLHVINPPSVSDYEPFMRAQLRAIATGLGVTYEDMTGDYTNLPFSAARMSRLRHQAQVSDWQWRILVAQFLAPVWAWAMEASALIGEPVIDETDWTTPAMPMIDPEKEGLAFVRNVRSGATSLSEAIRERGYNPDTHLEEMAADFKKLDDLDLVLDVDPRKMTQAGQLQGTAAAATVPPAPAASGDA